MSRYIESSQKIDIWLPKQGVLFDPDKTAPRVYLRGKHYHYVGCHPPNGDKAGLDRYICPYFGPGGSDNSFKALRACEMKAMGILQFGGIAISCWQDKQYSIGPV